MSIETQLADERDMLIQSLAINQRAQEKRWTMAEVSARSTLRINPRLSKQRQHVLHTMNNRAACHDPIRIEESRKVLDEWVTEFNSRVRRMGYSSLTVHPGDHLHFQSRRIVR